MSLHAMAPLFLGGQTVRGRLLQRRTTRLPPGLTAPHEDSAARLRALAPQRTDPVCARLPKTVSLYCVGGAVRDALLGEHSADHDFLVVGATPQAMLDAGFRPVGRDFPVFLHPTSQAEYALARTERKMAWAITAFNFRPMPASPSRTTCFAAT